MIRPVHKPYRYPYYLLTAYLLAVITTMAMANKIISFGPVILPAGIFIFPFSFLVNDIAAEAYGYSYPRLFIWLGLISTLIFSLYSITLSWTHAPTYFTYSSAYKTVFDPTFRFFISTIVSLFVAEFINIFLLAKSKIRFQGRFFILRSLGSTAIAQAALSISSDIVAFSGNTSGISHLINMMLSGFLVKMAIAILAVFPSWLIVRYLIRKDAVDHYDINTRFTPFSLSIN